MAGIHGSEWVSRLGIDDGERIPHLTAFCYPAFRVNVCVISRICFGEVVYSSLDPYS